MLYIFYHYKSEVMLFFLAVLPKKGQEILHVLEIDKEHLAQDGGL